VLEALEAARDSGSYPGRFARLAALGENGIDALVEFAEVDVEPDGGLRLSPSFDRHAIEALGDIPHPRSIQALEVLAERTRTATVAWVGDEIACSLHRLGKPAMLRGIIAELESYLSMCSRDVEPSPSATGVVLSRRFASYFLKAERLTEGGTLSVGKTICVPGESHCTRYHMACLWSKSDESKKALKVLRELIEGVSGDLTPWERWLQVDDDLAAARRLPGFQYLVACCIARNRIDAGWPAADPKHVRAAIDALAKAGGAGYRIEHQRDYLGMLIGLRDHPEFERLWAAMGGTPAVATQGGGG